MIKITAMLRKISLLESARYVGPSLAPINMTITNLFQYYLSLYVGGFELTSPVPYTIYDQFFRLKQFDKILKKPYCEVGS